MNGQSVSSEDEGSSDEDDADQGEDDGRRRDPQRDVRLIAEMLDIDISLIFVSNQVRK